MQAVARCTSAPDVGCGGTRHPFARILALGEGKVLCQPCTLETVVALCAEGIEFKVAPVKGRQRT